MASALSEQQENEPESAGFAVAAAAAAADEDRKKEVDEDEQFRLAMAISLSDNKDREEEQFQEALRQIRELDATTAASAQTNSWNTEGDGNSSFSLSSMDEASLESISVKEYQAKTASRKHYDWKELDESDSEYREIKEDFDAVGVKITRVRKVRNHSMLKRFETRGFEMQDDQPKGAGFDLNVHMLYHGSTAREKQVCREGLDSRLGKKGHFGRGIYFSDNPKKCVQFMARSGPGTGSNQEPYILRCRVILGDVKEYPPGRVDMELNREPVKANTEDRTIYYDSVKGMPNKDGLNEFVIYESRSALIEHIINYDPNAPVDPPTPRPSTTTRQADAGAAGGAAAIVPLAPSNVSTAPIEGEELTLNIEVGGDVSEQAALDSLAENRPTEMQPTENVVEDNDTTGFNIVEEETIADGDQEDRFNIVEEEDTAMDGGDEIDGDIQGAAAAAAAVAPPLPSNSESVSSSGDAGNMTLKICDTTADPQMKEMLKQVEAQLRSKAIGDEAMSTMLLDAFEKTYIESHPDVYKNGTQQASNLGGAEPVSSDVSSDVQNFEMWNPAEAEVDCAEEVENHLINQFLVVTESSDMEEARTYIRLANMNLDDAVFLYYDEKQCSN